MPDATSQALSDDLISDIAAEHEVYALLPNLVAFVTAILAKQREMDAKAEPTADVLQDGATVRLQWASVQAAHNARPGPLFARPPAAQDREPMTDEQRTAIVSKWRGRNWTVADIVDAVEAHHGIKEPQR